MKTETEKTICEILKDVEEQAIHFSELAALLGKACRVSDTAKIHELSKAQQNALNVLGDVLDHRNKLWNNIVYQQAPESKGAA